MWNSAMQYPPGVKPIDVMELIGGNKKLPPRLYNVVFNPMTKKLEIVPAAEPKFRLPERIYGKAPDYASHFWEAYEKSTGNLGVILTGEKGTGKTELGNLISNMGIDKGYPVLNIYEIPYNSLTDLIDLLENIGEAVVFFDEFGKNFSYRDQEKLLPVLSRTTGGRKFYIFTDNSYHALNPFIRSRPGRARYHLDFKRLEEDVVKEYAKDKNVSKKFYNDLLKFYRKASRFTFDYLKALVEEHLLFPDKDFEDLIKFMNIDELKVNYVLKVTDIEVTDDKNQVLKVIKYKQSEYPPVKHVLRGRPLPILIELELEEGKAIQIPVVITKKNLKQVKTDTYIFDMSADLNLPNGEKKKLHIEIEAKEVPEDEALSDISIQPQMQMHAPMPPQTPPNMPPVF